MAMWNPWRGCHRYSEGCKYCYIHKGDAKRGVDTELIVKTSKMTAPIERYVRGKNAGRYKMGENQTVYVCFSSDFLIEEADAWRGECWEIIKQRPDLNFLFLTKRIERFESCMPADWADGYDNVIVGCTVENAATAAYRLPIFDKLPIKHKNIICQPLIERISINDHLGGVELVVVGGESDRSARPLDYDWVLAIRDECISRGVKFEFRQCGTHFIKDGRMYTLNVGQLAAQARKADINT